MRNIEEDFRNFDRLIEEDFKILVRILPPETEVRFRSNFCVALSTRHGFGAIFALHVVLGKVSELFSLSPSPRECFEAILAYGSVEGLYPKLGGCFRKKLLDQIH